MTTSHTDIADGSARNYSFAFDMDGVSDLGEFEGYGSTFGNVDTFGHVVEAGAFTASLADARRQRRVIPMLWAHQTADPIGVWKSIREDSHGLHVRGKLLKDSISRARQTWELMRENAIGGMSIGFTVPKGGAATDRNGVVRFKSIDLVEISLCSIPVNTEARFTGVKSFESVRDVARFFREHGVARAAAERLAAGGYPALARPAAETDLSAMVARMKAATRKLKEI
jgi:HK97 family phage prohead protease